MSTQAQITANRANSKLSTGPRTEAGKAASSQNNIKLGLSCRTFAVLAGEDQEKFDNYAIALLREYDPQTKMERTLVMKIAQHHWLSQRAFVSEQMLLDEMGLPDNQDDERRLALLLRYQAHHDRAFHKTRNELDKLIAARQKREQPAQRPAPAVPKVAVPHPPAAEAEPTPQPESQTPATIQPVPINKAA